ncbi:MAG: hypothetical protein DMG97_34920 [Acidobacteria bacterium]|nr:MAG: hypothetical protein DMG97_34920 [Acidobacteriota bacterium]
MRKGRWVRLQSLVKLFLGSLFSGNRVWIKTYPATFLYWLAVRRHYLWMKVRDRELRQILSQIENRNAKGYVLEDFNLESCTRS